jgi:hypothetical protein
LPDFAGGYGPEIPDAAVLAMRQTLRTLRETGVGRSVDELTAPLQEIYELVELNGIEAAEARFLPAPDPRTLSAYGAPGEGVGEPRGNTVDQRASTFESREESHVTDFS